MAVKALIFDTETTALIENSLLSERHQPRITEFYGNIVEDDGTVLEELEFMCNPGHPLPPEIVRITGITDADLKDKLMFRHHEASVRKLIGSAEAVVAHNLAYDHAVLMREFDRCETMDLVRWPLKRICTVQETEWFKGHRLNLGGLYEHLFNEPMGVAHRAKADVKALTRCYLELRKRGDI